MEFSPILTFSLVAFALGQTGQIVETVWPVAEPAPKGASLRLGIAAPTLHLTRNGEGHATLSPDGRYLAISYDNTSCSVRERIGGKELFVLKHSHLPFSGNVNPLLLRFSPDSKLLFFGAHNLLQVVAVPSGKPIQMLRGTIQPVYFQDGRSFASTADASVVAVRMRLDEPGGTSKGLIAWWKPHEGGAHKSLEIPSGPGYSISLSPDGKTLALAIVSRDASDKRRFTPSIEFWDLQEKKQTAKLDLTTLTDANDTAALNTIKSAVYSPDGKYLAVYNGKDIALADANAQKTVRWFISAEKDMEYWPAGVQRASPADDAVQFSPDGKRITAYGGVRLRAWEVETGKAIPIKSLPEEEVLAVAFPEGEPESLWILTKIGRTLSWRDAVSGKVGFAATGNTNFISSIAFSGDGANLMSVDLDGNLIVWNAATGAILNKHWIRDKGRQDPRFLDQLSPSLSPWGQFVSSPIAQGLGEDIFDVKTQKKLHTFDSDPVRRRINGNSHKICFSYDEQQLVMVADDRATIVDARTGKLEQTFQRPDSYGKEALNLALSADRKLLCVVDETSAARQYSNRPPPRVLVYDLATEKLLHTLPAKATARLCEFSPDSQTLAISEQGGVLLYSAQSGKLRRTFTLTDSARYVSALRFSPGGKYLAVASYLFVADKGKEARIDIIDADTAETARTITDANTPVSRLAFDAAGKRLASAGTDSSILIWPMEAGDAKLAVPPGLTTPKKRKFAPGAPNPILVQAVKKLGGDFRPSYTAPSLHTLSLQRAISNEQWKDLRPLMEDANVEFELNLRSIHDLTDEAVDNLKGLSWVRELTISSNLVTDRAMLAICEMPNLQVLSFSSNLLVLPFLGASVGEDGSEGGDDFAEFGDALAYSLGR